MGQLLTKFPKSPESVTKEETVHGGLNDRNLRNLYKSLKLQLLIENLRILLLPLSSTGVLEPPCKSSVNISNLFIMKYKFMQTKKRNIKSFRELHANVAYLRFCSGRFFSMFVSFRSFS